MPGMFSVFSATLDEGYSLNIIRYVVPHGTPIPKAVTDAITSINNGEEFPSLTIEIVNATFK